jgi:Ran GTPase-activating protein (RanGAP) involved in mRNA processing and transport
MSLNDETAVNIGNALKTTQALTNLVIQIQDLTLVGAESLATGIREAPHLTHVDISLRHDTNVSNNPAQVMERLLLQGVKRSTTIHHVRLSGPILVSDNTMPAVATLVRNNRKLHTLVLDHVTLDDEMAEMFADALKKNKCLTHLTIPVQDMTTHAAQRLADAVRAGARKINTLTLSLPPTHTTVSNDTMITWLLQGVHGSPTIKNLILSGTLGDLPTLVLILPMLHSLSIQDVVLSEKDVETISRTIREQTKRLSSLSLNGCQLQSNHMHILTAHLMTHAPLKNIDVRRNCIGDTGIAAMILNYTSDWVQDQTWDYHDNRTMFDRY